MTAVLSVSCRVDWTSDENASDEKLDESISRMALKITDDLTGESRRSDNDNNNNDDDFDD